MKRTLLNSFLAAVLCAAVVHLRADYPIVAHRYLADPSTMVHEGRVYVYCSNDDDNNTGGGYDMKSIVCVSSSDLKNWTDHGEVLRVPRDAAWAIHSWAPSAIARNGQFYLYFANNASGIGVATSSSPTGPFTDPRGSALIDASTPGVLPADNIWIFDPGVFIDDDGQAYMYFGGNGESNVRIIRLNEDMISTSGTAIPLTVQYFFEAAWMHQRNGTYYLSYSTNPANGLRIDYLTADNPLGPFTYRGIVAGQPPSNNNNNHAAIFELNGAWYHVYHNRIVATQAGIPTTYRRNIAIERLTYNPDGTIQQVTYTTDGVPQVGHLDPYVRVEAETMASQSGIETQSCSEGGMNVTELQNGDWIRVRGVDFGSPGASEFQARVASAGAGGNIELRLDGPAGTLIGTCVVNGTGGAQNWATVSTEVTGAAGVHDLYLRFTGTGSSLFNINWWQFAGNQPPEIKIQPRSLTLNPGARLSLWVEAVGTGALQYQWRKDGVDLPDATSRFYEVAMAAAEDAGVYTVEVANSVGPTLSQAATITLNPTASTRLVNMSVRSPLASGAVLIPGFVTSGSGSSQMLIRAVGPKLKDLGVGNPLPDPTMTLYNNRTKAELLTNDNWSDAPNAAEIADVANALKAFSLPVGSADAAAVVDLSPDLYTTHIRGVGGTSGVVLFELYEGDGGNSRLVNISARGDIGTGENVLIPGFYLQGNAARTLLIRAVGPSLGKFGVQDWLEDPVLTIYQGATPILTNDNWEDAPDPAALATISDEVGAFSLLEGSTDAAALVVLMPGGYTAVARGANGGVGNVLVEVYLVP